MVKFKVVMGLPNGSSVQKELEGEEAEALLKKRLGEPVSGDLLGYSGYEFLVTGGSDKCGFPMRKGILEPRKKILISGSVGFSGLKRFLNKKKNRRKQKGLISRTTVCGELITKIIHQVNLKVVKEGEKPLDEKAGKETAVKSA